MQWLLSIDMMDMLTDLWCACWLRMDRQSSIVLLGIIIPRTYWIDSCCCWVNVVVHVHVPVHRGFAVDIDDDDGFHTPVVGWCWGPCGIVLMFSLSMEPILTIKGDGLDILQSVISLTSRPILSQWEWCITSWYCKGMWPHNCCFHDDRSIKT